MLPHALRPTESAPGIAQVLSEKYCEKLGRKRPFSGSEIRDMCRRWQIRIPAFSY